MRLPAILSTTAARLSALFLLLFMACAVVLVMYMTSLSVRMLTAQTHTAIDEEIQEINQTYQIGGLPGLVRAVDRRARQPGASLFLIADPSGRILAGNVESLDPRILSRTGWTTRPFAYTRYGEKAEGGNRDEAADHHALARVFALPNGLIMLVGRDLGEPERLRVVVRRALILALAMMAAGGFLIWFFVGRRALKRIDAVSSASRRIMGGELDKRLPVYGSNDEFDRLSANLNTMLDRIGELNTGVKQVADNIAHDLKTPLTRLRNRAEAALAGDPDKAGYRAALEANIAESDQLIRTFNAILMISRLEAGNAVNEKVPVDLAAIARDVCELYEPLAEEAGVRLACNDLAMASVNGNRELIGQALSNIVDNAIKYAGGAGRDAHVTIGLAMKGAAAALTVCDNGPGIGATDRERVTERFVRLEQSRSQPGSGLGLSLAKAVMKFHDGRLDLADANPGLCVSMEFSAGEGRK
ncbi:MAG: HAMP domain-containing protein [Notoacmeibacter sp.]|nr:HAMP domain-containing protein [Notoacmeibacter sp.]